ncbi:hypothetical protein FGB62_136g011 [Gracilaria domingensis]|nr:hypothetical protein FGB62_136g011 [Gracilaria domingensis]
MKGLNNGLLPNTGELLKSEEYSLKEEREAERRKVQPTLRSQDLRKNHIRKSHVERFTAPPELSSHSITSLISLSPVQRVVALTEVMKRSEYYIGIEKQPLPHPANYVTPHADVVIGYDMKLSTLDLGYNVMKIRHQCN